MQQSVAVRRASPTPPLVADLDGTLVKTDLLAQSFFGLLAARPVRALDTLTALLHGIAAAKAALAGQVDLECATLPFNPELLAFIRVEHAKGRAIYLASASAADRRLVEAVADALGLFAGVFASDGTTNLASAAKAQVLCDAFGVGGFDYVGNARSIFPSGRRHAVSGSRVPARTYIAESSRAFRMPGWSIRQAGNGLIIFAPRASISGSKTC
ncbi:MAG: hypothetical protein ACRED7_06060 [Stellaceae bacterium]